MPWIRFVSLALVGLIAFAVPAVAQETFKESAARYQKALKDTKATVYLKDGTVIREATVKVSVEEGKGKRYYEISVKREGRKYSITHKYPDGDIERIETSDGTHVLGSRPKEKSQETATKSAGSSAQSPASTSKDPPKKVAGKQDKSKFDQNKYQAAIEQLIDTLEMIDSQNTEVKKKSNESSSKTATSKTRSSSSSAKSTSKTNTKQPSGASPAKSEILDESRLKRMAEARRLLDEMDREEKNKNVQLENYFKNHKDPGIRRDYEELQNGERLRRKMLERRARGEFD